MTETDKLAMAIKDAIHALETSQRWIKETRPNAKAQGTTIDTLANGNPLDVISAAIRGLRPYTL